MICDVARVCDLTETFRLLDADVQPFMGYWLNNTLAKSTVSPIVLCDMYVPLLP